MARTPLCAACSRGVAGPGLRSTGARAAVTDGAGRGGAGRDGAAGLPLPAAGLSGVTVGSMIRARRRGGGAMSATTCKGVTGNQVTRPAIRTKNSSDNTRIRRKRRSSSAVVQGRLGCRAAVTVFISRRISEVRQAKYGRNPPGYTSPSPSSATQREWTCHRGWSLPFPCRGLPGRGGSPGRS